MFMQEQSSVLITGATGFVGRTLVAMLPKARAAVRSEAAGLAAVSTVRVGEIDDRTDWGAALEGMQCVVHLAARVHIMRLDSGDQSEFHKTNVLGTLRLASMAAQAGVRRFIFLSSVKVNGEVTLDRAFAAADSPRPEDAYAISKWHAEQALFEIGERSGMEVVAIRAPLVYGPGVRANFLRLLRWIDSGVPLPFGAVTNRRSMVSVWNLCDLIATLVRIDNITAGVLMVSDGADISTPELISLLANSMGRRGRLMRVPVRVLQVLGTLAGKRPEVERLCQSLQVDISATQQQLDWTPPVPIDEGLLRTGRWYREQVLRT